MTDAMRRGGMLLRTIFKGTKWTASKLPEETLKKDYLASIGLSKKDAHRWQVLAVAR